jgi:hypothetical protein
VKEKDDINKKALQVSAVAPRNPSAPSDSFSQVDKTQTASFKVLFPDYAWAPKGKTFSEVRQAFDPNHRGYVRDKRNRNGEDFVQAVKWYFAALVWPSSAKDQSHAGISWFEISLDFIISTGYVFTFPAGAHSWKFLKEEVARTATQLNQRCCLWPAHAVPSARVGSLCPLGIRTQFSGLSLRPLILSGDAFNESLVKWVSASAVSSNSRGLGDLDLLQLLTELPKRILMNPMHGCFLRALNICESESDVEQV